MAQATAGLLPQPLLTNAALLSALARLDPGAGVDQLAYAARRVFLTRAAGGTSRAPTAVSRRG
ncbi:hypothetical protein OG900_37545 [Streptomyces sp. NBC_00433]